MLLATSGVCPTRVAAGVLATCRSRPRVVLTSAVIAGAALHLDLKQRDADLKRAGRCDLEVRTGGGLQRGSSADGQDVTAMLLVDRRPNSSDLDFQSSLL